MAGAFELPVMGPGLSHYEVRVLILSLPYLSRRVIEMVAIFECLECGHHAVYRDESKLDRCPLCGDVHTDVTYGLELIPETE